MNIIPMCITSHDMKLITGYYITAAKAAQHACFSTDMKNVILHTISRLSEPRSKRSF